ncbi:SusC/RagA family TonB-linked outer membrane protein [Chitinophaga sp. sic0106]|uniref:SusC/RagA family TonB-linked outer membrane protein n=1 Tax=Chitinophaga sp. sic0106 TaxID=2854785 RepID=UPI001C452B85|nr:SusC/RagA family TonB-linked outer membrane protein [Chitinophaga sp. sic0106]MBV7530707.1 SusC/RagA family TonB-linked outer membrane protein [Chitinophaga sp. sic0106]
MHKFANSNRYVIFFMRVALLQISLLLGFITCVFADGATAQEILNTRLSLNLPPTELKGVLKKITEKTAVNFTYSNATLSAKQRVAVNVKEERLGDVLLRILAPLHISYEVINEQIVLKKENGMGVQLSDFNLQLKKISGVVHGTDGGLLPGVNVVIAGTTKGAVTDGNGHFELDASEGDVLVFTSIGFTTQRVTVGAGTTLTITLATSATSLDGVAVTALGIKRSVRALGYSQEEVKGAEIARSNAPNVINALSGKMAGVNVTTPNGVDGGSTRIVIGGNNTIQGDNQPLIIVDGMPMANDLPTGYDARKSPTGSAMYSGASVDASSASSPKDFGSPINMINPEDIETINVLKGPTAAALYGGKGANGVILITTKKGAKKPGLGVDYSYGYKSVDPYRFLKMQNEYGAGGMVSLNAPDYVRDANGNPMLVDSWNGLFVDKNGTGPYGVPIYQQAGWSGNSLSWGPKMDGTMIKWWDGTMQANTPQPDNIKLLYSNGQQSTHNVSLSGGNEWGSIRASFSHLDNTSVLPNSGYGRNNFNLGSNMRLTKRVTAQITASYIINNYDNPPQLGNNDASSWQKRLVYNTGRNYKGEDIAMYKNEDGSQNKTVDAGFPWRGNGGFVIWNIMENKSTLDKRKLLGGVQLNYEATDFLDIVFRGGLDNNTNELTTKNPPTDAAGMLGYYGHGLERDNASNLELIATAHKEKMMNGNLSGKFSVGGTLYQREMYGTYNYNDTWAIPFNYSLNSGTYLGNPKPTQESWLRKRMNSVYGFVNLSWKNYLFLDATGRNDWSSALPANQWSYFFPSVAGSFVFSDLLHADPAILSFGKLRVAWAQAAVDPLPFQVNYNYNAETFAGQAALMLPNSLPAMNFKPAINNTTDIGVVLGFLNNRINVDLRYFKGKSRNQILNSPLPLSSGVKEITVNSGVLENSGYEMILNAKVVTNKNFKWDLGLNLAHSNNKLLSLSEGAERVDMASVWNDNGAHGPMISAKVGDQFGTIYGYDYQRDAQGRPILADAPFGRADMKGTLYKATDGPVPIGNATPKLTGGITNTFTLPGGVSIGTLVDFKIGGDIWSGTYATMMQGGLAPATLTERNGGGLPYTTPDGTQTNWGVILPGVYADGKENDKVVHYYYKYMQYGVWSSTDIGQSTKGSDWINSGSIFENTWVKMREISVNYQVPERIIKRTRIFQAANLSLVGRDLFYIYTNLPFNINPEGVNGAGNAQGLEYMSLPSFRSLGFQVRVSF